MENELIVVRQLPVIEERLRSVRAEIEDKTKEAMSLVCTEDTYRDVKKVRSELNRQFDALEEQRKQVKKAVLAPYETFEKTYRECITEPFAKADADLKRKIGDVEGGIKAAKADEAAQYYYELLRAEELEWIGEMGYHPKVTMSTSIKALKEQAKAQVEGFKKDIVAIHALPDSAEIMVEYRRTLDASGAIRAVAERHAALEAQHKRDEEREKRAKEKIDAFINQNKTEKAAQVLGADPESAQPTPDAKPAEVELQPRPVAEKVYSSRFWAKGTIAQLKGLKDYMERSGINYGAL